MRGLMSTLSPLANQSLTALDRFITLLAWTGIYCTLVSLDTFALVGTRCHRRLPTSPTMGVYGIAPGFAADPILKYDGRSGVQGYILL